MSVIWTNASPCREQATASTAGGGWRIGRNSQIGGWNTPNRDVMKVLAIERPNDAERGAAQSGRPYPEHRVEHRRRLPGEALITCNTSAVAVCCSSASRCSVEQPRVLHRDHRLGSEVLQQGDLLAGECSHFLAKDRERPNALVWWTRRRPEQMERMPPSSTAATLRETRSRNGAVSLDGLFSHRPAEQRPRVEPGRFAC